MQVTIDIPEGKYCDKCQFNDLGKNGEAFVQVCRYYYRCKLELKDNHYLKHENCPLLKNENMSDALFLINFVWKSVLKTKPFSDYRVRSIMSNALDIAIKGGFKFDKDDCKKIAELCRLGSGYYTEQYLTFDKYSTAVAAGNVSACQAFEHHHNFKPFIAKGIDAPDIIVAGKCCGTNPTGRIAVGSRFKWNNDIVEVTSFSDDYTYFRACSYEITHPNQPGYDRKVKHIYKINHENLKSLRETVK